MLIKYMPKNHSTIKKIEGARTPLTALTFIEHETHKQKQAIERMLRTNSNNTSSEPTHHLNSEDIYDEIPERTLMDVKQERAEADIARKAKLDKIKSDLTSNKEVLI